MCGCLSHDPYWGPGPQPGMCPDWESNQRPSGLQASTQSTAPQQPGHIYTFIANKLLLKNIYLS